MYQYNFYVIYGRLQQNGEDLPTIRRELQKMLGVTKGTLSNYEKATKPLLSPIEIQAVCKRLGVTESEFVNEINEI
jgi:transcriptional regulator with XRE-family HTH domain